MSISGISGATSTPMQAPVQRTSAQPVRDADGDFDGGKPDAAPSAAAAKPSGVTPTLGNNLNVVA